MTDIDMAILDFEHEWWRHAGSKDQEVLQRWGMLPPQYHERLTAIAGCPDAWAYDPLTVYRLRRRLAPITMDSPR